MKSLDEIASVVRAGRGSVWEKQAFDSNTVSAMIKRIRSMDWIRQESGRESKRDNSTIIYECTIAISIVSRQSVAAIWLLDYAKWRCSALRLTDNIFNRW